MNILAALYSLQALFQSTRGAGHTKFARSIGKVGGVLICADEQSARQFARTQPEDQDFALLTVSMHDRRSLEHVALRKHPVVLDNYAVMKICSEAIHEIQEKHELLQISEQARITEKKLYALEIQGLQKHYEARIASLENNIFAWKRIARMFRYANPRWMENNLESKRQRR